MKKTTYSLLLLLFIFTPGLLSGTGFNPSKGLFSAGMKWTDRARDSSDTPKNIKPMFPSSDEVPERIRFMLGVGLYEGVLLIDGYPPIFEKELCYNLGVESKARRLGRKWGISHAMHLQLYPNMQKAYRKDSNGYNIMYLTKYYLSIGESFRYRFGKNAFVLGVNPTLNYTTGKIEDIGRAGYMTFGLHTGQYYQRFFGTYSNGSDAMFVRIGFDQYFTLFGQFIGSFSLRIGI